jgi:glutamate synthase (NADPH/NADH) small chain
VTIRQIELAIIEKGFESDFFPIQRAGPRSDKRIAVIGSGPAGLAVADTLNQAGFRVTVYESAAQAGGILRYGIPDFKLEKWVVDRRIRLMEEEGVVFETGVTAGEDISYPYMTRLYKAICLCCGARESRDLSVPGRDLKGVYFALDYLMQQNKRNGGEGIDPSGEITAKGKRVVVLGGGDTGSDCLGTALRQGAEKVYQFEILPKPPLERPASTPWPMWPNVLRKTHAHEEGGEQRWSVMTTAFFGENGLLRELHGVEVEWESQEEGGPPIPVKKQGTEFNVEADLVLLATGFVGPARNRIVEDLGIARDSRGNVMADENHMTSVPGVFVSGDMVLGQSLVVKAIADGRRAAKAIMEYVEGR